MRSISKVPMQPNSPSKTRYPFKTIFGKVLARAYASFTGSQMKNCHEIGERSMVGNHQCCLENTIVNINNFLLGLEPVNLIRRKPIAIKVQFKASNLLQVVDEECVKNPINNPINEFLPRSNVFKYQKRYKAGYSDGRTNRAERKRDNCKRESKQMTQWVNHLSKTFTT